MILATGAERVGPSVRRRCHEGRTRPHRAGNAGREPRSILQGHRVPGACAPCPKQQPGKLNNDATALKHTEAAPASSSAYCGLAKQ